ncbi:MAG: aminotransferase class I/II-fold pyridoxal phosphate-dependent enzyme [Bacteroidetes bacterium]|nr:aminotransferase class I/II-fold pyridoxal phosphate-dependent enzyme [Bacteroidota bacterium]
MAQEGNIAETLTTELTGSHSGAGSFTEELKVSGMAETLIGSEIIKLAGEIREKIKSGEKILNFTIGDFDPQIFPIPEELNHQIIASYNRGETNYPPAEGIPELRKSVSLFLRNRQHLAYKENDILIACGARPLIYGIYRTVLDPGDTVIYPLPSWNNNHYCHLAGANGCPVETSAERNFMPTGKDIEPFIADANLIALCSPLNPSGTIFSETDLSDICELVLHENRRRKGRKKPVYLLYDQIYWLLTYGSTKHVDPVSLHPAMADYTFYVDGISKYFSGTGVRVGWAFGPGRIVEKMKSILSHVGAWAPRAEQCAVSRFLCMDNEIDNFLYSFKKQVQLRLDGIYDGLMKLKAEGFAVDAIAPQASIYLTVRLNLHGYRTGDGRVLVNTADVTRYILEEAKIALVPFYAFGSGPDSTWYRLSVGTARPGDVEDFYRNLRNALSKLSL